MIESRFESHSTKIFIAQNLSNASEEIKNHMIFEKVTPPEITPTQAIASELEKSVFGQSEACNAVAESIVRSLAGFKSNRKPLGSFLFLGPTGVGKTELARAMTRYLFPTNPEEHFVKIDCTDLQDPSSVTRLKGSDPKYVGFGGDVLIMPYHLEYGAVVLFDEIEKAHPEVWKWLMPILDEGKTTLFLPTDQPSPNGSGGRAIEPTTLDFKKSWIVFTSNEGAEIMQQARSGKNFGIGFRGKINQHESTIPNYQEIARHALLTGRFRSYPEFLGRIETKVGFNDLQPEHYAKIFEKFLNQANNDLAANDPRHCITLLTTNRLREWILNQADTNNYGARNILHTLEQTLLRKAAEYKIAGKFKPHAFVLADVEDDEIVFFQSTAFSKTAYNESTNYGEYQQYKVETEPLLLPVKTS
ncbi:MAG: hypothetical protein KatS3mg089_0310 [Patescibacteria group bacterium]|nr:MAG: hypothetical protein KatS3mg089_0310 [Patescibacteria group bacterium]